MSKKKDLSSNILSYEEKSVVHKVNFYYKKCLFSQRNLKFSPEKEEVEEISIFSVPKVCN